MDELENYMESSTRLQRYRMAEKTLRFPVYSLMEKFVLFCFLLLLVSIWVESELYRNIVFYISWCSALVGITHYFKEALTKPWLLLAAITESLILYGVYIWWLSEIIELPGFGLFCIFLFIARYWQRGEREVNISAFNNYKQVISNN